MLLSTAAPWAAAGAIDAESLCRTVAAETAAWRPFLDPALVAASPTRDGQLPLFRELIAAPDAAPCRAARLAASAAAAIASPTEAMRWLSEVGGVALKPRPPATRISAVDPLAAALEGLRPSTPSKAESWTAVVPSREQLPEPLRREVALLLAAIGGAREQLIAATARLPTELDAASLRAQALHGTPPPAPELDILHLLPRLDRERLAQGMVDLVAAVERFARFAAIADALPAVIWRIDTPLGEVIVDTTGRDNDYTLAAPLLVVDIGGNDRYRFTAAPPARHVSVLVDLGGHDAYVAAADGADPSAATVGYGVLWDSDDDDVHQGGHLAQAAAVLGAALLFDGGGIDRFSADGHAQGYAFGGLALLLASGGGDDAYDAVTHAQGSGGPMGVAALLDGGGDDAYTLRAEPLLRPSPQLATHNTSMGQGAGRGWRPSADRDGAAGGIGILIDLAGNDRYAAQVFAQGAGFYEGLGLLVDGGGHDTFDAAWYAMGAAAHAAAGVFVKLGGDDRYRASHSTSLGAAHDHSLAAFVDAGGDDTYSLGDLGLGASHEDGVALFIDGSGRNRYQVEAAVCRAFGWTKPATPNAPTRAKPPRAPLARFADHGCAAAAERCARDCAR